ncbi:Glycoside hydrolase, partial [Globisporangium splendens]
MQQERAFQSGVQVFIPAALNRPTHTLYSICMVVQPTAQEWTVNRRYSQFLQLKKDLLATLAGKGRCPGCASFHIALSKFAFPPKALMRTNSVVRKRVTALQDFLKFLVERIFNDLPKCAICGDDVKKMVRPFLIRGAQPIGPSIVTKINASLSLQSYAYVPRTIPGPGNPPVKPKNKNLDSSTISNSTQSDDSYSSTRRNDSDPVMELPSSPSASEAGHQSSASSSRSSEDSYGKDFGDERCHDSKVPLEEAIKQVVLPKGMSATYEEVLIRLSSMWDAYEDTEAVLASLSPDRRSKRLSATRESVDEVSF